MADKYVNYNGLQRFWNGIKSKFLQLAGGTMTGQLKTSFKSSVAIGSYQAAAATIPNLVEEVRYSSGCMGSASITTAYNDIGTDWYNFIWVPHRTGGLNGTDPGGDNVKYGNLLLFSMTSNKGRFIVRCVNASIVEVVRITDSNSLYEAYLKWGGKNIAADVSPNDMGCIDEFGHNKLAFLDPSCITIEYTTDGGNTWLDYGASNEAKVLLVTSGTPAILIGKGTARANNGTMTNQNCSNYKVRVEICTRKSNGTAVLYTASKKWLINYSSEGANDATVKLETKTVGDYNNSVDNWANRGSYPIAGWSGWNSIPSPIGAIGGSATQTSNIASIRFTLSIGSVNTSYASTARFLSFRLIGSTLWTYPSKLAATGQLYDYNYLQEATFPAKVTAPTFEGALSGNATSATNDKNGNDITTTYVSYTTSSQSVAGNTKNVSKVSPETLYVPNGLIMGGTAQAAGLVTRGICGIGTPDNNGACSKENLYINYDGSNTFNANRQIVSSAGTIGNHLGSNMYQYTLPRGEVVKNWVEAKGYTSNTGTVTSVAVKMNNTTKGTVTTSGTIDLGTVITAHDGKFKLWNIKNNASTVTLTPATSSSNIDIVAGSNVSLIATNSTQGGSSNNAKIIINATDTTYSEATSTTAGLLSAADKIKIDTLENPGQYSRNEVAVGTWIDGQTIYRKVISGTPSTQASTVAHNVTNFGAPINCYGFYKRNSDGAFEPMPGTYTNWECWMYDFTSTKFTLKFSNNAWNSGIAFYNIVLDYIKTSS